MSTERFDDEILSAIIDGEADQELLASVADDPTASARLEQLRAAVAAVRTPIPDASPERRASSIAAAMAAATPAPEVSSLAAARHTRDEQNKSRRLNPQWVAVAAAAILLIVAIPLLLRSTDSADFATSADDTTDASRSFDADDSGTDDAAESADVAAEAATDASAGLAEQEASSEEASADEAMADAGDADDSPSDVADDTSEAPQVTNGFRLAEAQVANSVEVLQDLISLGSIVPELTADEVIAEGVAPECVDALDVEGGATFSLAFLDPFGGGPRLVLISFNADGTSTTLDAEDCAPLG